MKVLVSDAMSETGIDILKKADNIEVDVNTGLSEDELVNIISEYSALIVRRLVRKDRLF